ncbi:MAG: lysylphosphatidylglycerol synthase domain-containing protein [Chitinophagaceae bacterium]
MAFARRRLFLPLMQLNKNIKIFINYFAGPLLFCWLAFSIYNQIVHQPGLLSSWLHIKESFTSNKFFYLIVVVLLMLVNWGIEAWKWKISVDVLHRLPFYQAFKAVLSGVSFSVTTPNRIGEYLGRMIYVPEGMRLKIISITVVGSLSQILVTFIAGTAGFFLLQEQLLKSGLISFFWYQFIAFGLLGIITILTLFYFNLSTIEKWIEQGLKRSSWLHLIRHIQKFNMQLLIKLLLLSSVRYCVFMMQYILLFRLFDVNVPVTAIFWVMSLVFLGLAVIPTIALVEVGIRGEITLQLMGLFTINSLGVTLTSVSIWFINLIVPALAGSFFILSVKVFKQRHEGL